MKRSPTEQWRFLAFSLVELLVTVSIIAILAALCLPWAKSSIAQARNIKCMSNLAQIGKAIELYTGDNNQMLPAAYVSGDATSIPWMWKLIPYLGMATNSMGYAPLPRATGVFVCPEFKPSENRAVSYVINGNMNPLLETYWNYRKLIAPASQTFMVVEFNKNTEHFNTYSDKDVARRHPHKSANYLFIDGHVENLSEYIAPRQDPRWFNPGQQ